MKLKSIINSFFYLFYPLVLGGATCLSYWLFEGGEGSLIASALPIIVSYVFILLGEKLFPAVTSWNYSGKEFFVNLLHILVNSRLVIPFVKVLVISSFVALGNNIDLSFLHLWPHNWSLVFQLSLAVLITDFLIYWFHRWMHKSELGWRIHMVHHTTKNMNVFASSRSHPLNVFFVFLLEFGVLSLLGASSTLLVAWTVFMSVNGLFEHCNIKLKFSFLNLIMATAEVHRIHHNPDWDKSNSNFGNITCVWDRVFRTYFRPDGECKEQGLNYFKVPESYLDHLKTPFILDKYRKTN